MTNETEAGFPPVQGYALRVLFRRGRRFDDYVLFQPNSESRDGVEDPPGGEHRILSHSPIRTHPGFGPVLVVDRVLENLFDDAARWVEFATTDLIAGTRTDDPSRDPMSEEDFWQLISLLDGEIEHEGIAKLIESLSALPPLRLEAFRDSLWIKLHELDHPGNTIRFGGTNDGMLSADASLYYRCEIVARGRRAFVSAVESPKPGAGLDGSTGERLLSVVDSSSRHKLVDADVNIETGTNRAHWPEASNADSFWMNRPSLSPFSPRIKDVAYARRDEIALRLNFTSFVGYARGDDGHVRELMGSVMAETFANARSEVTEFLRSRLDPGEILDEHLIVWQSGLVAVSDGASMTGLSRRRSLSIDDYIDRYYIGSESGLHDR